MDNSLCTRPTAVAKSVSESSMETWINSHNHEPETLDPQVRQDKIVGAAAAGGRRVTTQFAH